LHPIVGSTPLVTLQIFPSLGNPMDEYTSVETDIISALLMTVGMQPFHEKRHMSSQLPSRRGA
jgi:hypothetical protein